MKWAYKVVFFLPRLLAQLPLSVLYVCSDILFLLIYYVAGYRKKLVRRQMAESFPEWKQQELKSRMKDFYHVLCDYVVETLWMTRLKPGEIERRVKFEGLEELQKGMEERGKQFGLFYLGHFGNWEWLASFALSAADGTDSAQIYHPLHNVYFDQFFLRLRGQFGGECIPMKETLRHVLVQKASGRKMLIGFIADQCPKFAASHHWTEFLHHQSAFFIGPESIGRKVDSVIAYVHVERPRRGYYHCRIQVLTWDPQNESLYSITDQYVKLFEQQIREHPELWLWTHNRWKRTYEQWLRIYNKHKE